MDGTLPWQLQNDVMITARSWLFVEWNKVQPHAFQMLRMFFSFWRKKWRKKWRKNDIQDWHPQILKQMTRASASSKMVLLSTNAQILQTNTVDSHLSWTLRQGSWRVHCRSPLLQGMYLRWLISLQILPSGSQEPTHRRFRRQDRTQRCCSEERMKIGCDVKFLPILTMNHYLVISEIKVITAEMATIIRLKIMRWQT